MSRLLEHLADYGGSPRTLRIIGAVLVVLLLALATLQYHWIGQLTEAKKSELQQAMSASAGRFSYEFNRELGRVYGGIVMGRPWSDVDSEERYVERFRQWSMTSVHPRIVKRLYVSKGDKLLMLDPENQAFEAVGWPEGWEGVRDDTRRILERYSRGPRLGGGPGGGNGGGPRPFSGAFDTLPVLASIRFERDAEGEPRPIGWAMAELDLDYIENELLPDMARRHFADNYQVLITNRADSSRIFSKGDEKSFGQADFEGALFEIVPQDQNRSGGRRFSRPEGERRREPGGGSGPGAGPASRPRTEGEGPRSEPPMRAMGPGSGGGPGGGPRGGRWVLQLKHTAGSLDRAVQALRYKNLGISFVILLLMGITIGAFVDSTRRARQLALQQMEFVASISHELRTPLTVICSAGDNLAGGVVKNESQVKRYGNLIRSEGRRLTDMVEQILGYAGIQKGRLPAPQAVEVESIVESALKACGQLIEASNCTVEREVEAGLPQISGDAASLSHSVQNLITNAVKYGGDWLRVTASASGEKWIRITVEDHGPGIEPKELRHIFEPFYRGHKAVDDQIHGTGLGLSLVKRIIEAHSGKVSVESAIGKGTRFTLELPAMARVISAEPANTAAVSIERRDNEATSTLG